MHTNIYLFAMKRSRSCHTKHMAQNLELSDTTCQRTIQTFPLSPDNELWVLLPLLTFDSHEATQVSVMVDNTQEFFHLSVVLLQVFVCLLLEDNHLLLGVVSESW